MLRKKTNLLAECPDEECDEYNDNWREVIALLERQKAEGVTYDKSKG